MYFYFFFGTYLEPHDYEHLRVTLVDLLLFVVVFLPLRLLPYEDSRGDIEIAWRDADRLLSIFWRSLWSELLLSLNVTEMRQHSLDHSTFNPPPSSLFPSLSFLFIWRWPNSHESQTSFFIVFFHTALFFLFFTFIYRYTFRFFVATHSRELNHWPIVS